MFPTMSECLCFDGRLIGHDEYEVTFIGVDDASGRFADVAVGHCRRCGRHWIHYSWEMEAFSRSGRWYRGLISEEHARTLTPGNAASLLESLEWYFVGGSYYEGKIYRSSGPLP
jgi:hypothetical protein